MNTNGNKVKFERLLQEARLNNFPTLTKEPSKNQNESTGKTDRQEQTETRERENVEFSRAFEQPVILQQSSVWSRAILWGLMGITTISVIWASVAKIEEAIPSQGKLEPTGTVKEIQAPVAGVVKAIHVEDGQQVKKGDRLISFDPTTSVAQLASLLKIRNTLMQENQFYQTQMRYSSDSVATEQAIAKLGLSPQLKTLVKSRSTLIAENQLFRTQLGDAAQTDLSAGQIERLQSDRAELGSRVAVARSEVDQLTRQLNQTQIEIANAQDTVEMNREILQNFAPLAKEGAMSRIQYLKQRQEWRNSTTEVAKLRQERERLLLEIGEAKSNLQNTIALDRKEVLTKIAENDKDIAEIDSQLTKAIVENDKRIAEIDSQISQAKQNLGYEEITAPADGTVFDLQAQNPGFVANTSQSLLKIVPNDALTAEVFITNKDIGFVKEGMDVDVRIDSFPYSEFGDVKGKLISIGSDALPPDEVHPFYRFPAKIRLDRQSVSVNGRNVPLQSGMSISANVRVRERTVMSIFTDLFIKNVEGLKFVR